MEKLELQGFKSLIYIALRFVLSAQAGFVFLTFPVVKPFFFFQQAALWNIQLIMNHLDKINIYKYNVDISFVY